MEKKELASVDERSIRKSPPPPKAAPWLVIPYGKDQKYQAFYNISEPNNTSCRKYIPELKGKASYQKNTHQGWSIVLCDDDEFDYTPWNYGDCFLWNPLSLETIELPSYLYWRTLPGYCETDCVLSSPPQTNTVGVENSMVFILFTRKKEKGKEILVFCRPGDQEWTTHHFSNIYDIGEHGFGFMFYFDGKLYIWGFGDEHLEIEIQHGSEPRILSTIKVQISKNPKYERIGVVWDTLYSMTYYVETSKEIFMIQKFYIPRGVYDYCITNVVVTKLDLCSMSWVEVTSLDDHVFFLTENTQLCCSAKELGFTHGCVYFTQPDEMSFYMYDLEDKTVMLSLPCPDLPNPWFSPNWLIIPTIAARWRNDHRRRGTESVSGSDGGNSTMAIEKTSLAASPVRTKTSINSDDEKEYIEETRPSDILSDDIVWFISSYLNPSDCLHLRAVCRNYRSMFPIVSWRRFCSTRSLQPTVQLSPWMVFAKDNESVYSFLNPMHNDENYLMSIPELLKGSTIRFSKGGWLLLSKGNSNVYFYNPFTQALIKLPDLPDDPGYQYRGISFSSLPTSSDCTVFAISDVDSDDDHDMGDSVFISFIKCGDKMWSYDDFVNVYLPPKRTNMDFVPSLNSPIFYNGAFYCLDVNGTLGVFTFENDRKWEVMSMVPPPKCDFIYKSYLVEFEGKLLALFLGHYGKWVRIFRLDMTEMVWVEVAHLGRHTLFISNTSCIAKTAPTSQMENRIYFPRLQNKGILYYSLDSGKYHSLGSENHGTDYCNSKELLMCSWIEPNWSETTQPNMDWS